MRDPQAGDFGLVPTHGSFRDRFAGWLIRWGCATPVKKRSWLMRVLLRVPVLGWLVYLLDSQLWVVSPVNHAFLYLGDGWIVEAEPRGACKRRLHYPADTITWSTGLIRLTEAQRQQITDSGEAFAAAKVKYGWLDILAIAVAQKRAGRWINADLPLARQPWWVKRIESMHTLICSQLVDVCYESAGLRLFRDGRVPGLVSPGDLYVLLAQAATTKVPV